MKRLADPFKRGIALRKQLVNGRGDVLCVDFAGTLQEKDITKDLIPDAKLGRYTYRAKINIKDFDNELREKQGLKPFDFSDEEAIFRTINDHKNFDIPLWFLRKAQDKLQNISRYDEPLIYQIMGCNFCDKRKTSGCIQCFVDNNSNVPDPKRGVWLSAKDNVTDTFEERYKSRGLPCIRTSGGEPTLVLDHILSLCQELDKRVLPILLQFDTNLSTGRLIEYFEDNNVYVRNILNRIAEYHPCVLVSLKGTTDENLQRNTQTRMTIADQIYSLKKLIKAGLDIYPFVYNPDPFHIAKYMEKLESIFENILLKTRVFMTKVYGPTRERLTNLAIPIEQQIKKWDADYFIACEKMNKLVNEFYGLDYKQIERYGVKINIKR